MDNVPAKSNKKKISKTVLICSFLAITIAGIIGWVFLSPAYKQHLSANKNETTAVETTTQPIENFVTDIKFEYFNDESAFVEYIEDCTNYDFPDNYYTDYFLAMSDNGGAVPFEKHDMICGYTCTVYMNSLSENELAEFEKQIAEDERFVENLGDLKILIDSVGGDNLYEYKMVYNMDTNEYNTMPEKAGEYSLITIFYDVDEHYFVISRFNNKYWKLEN